MNLMYKVLNQSQNETDNLILSLRQEMVDKKIKIVDNPEQTNFLKAKNGPIKSNGKDIFYYLNSIPKILKNRDVFKKPNAICEIKVDLEGKLTPENYKNEYDKLKTRYCFTFSTCQAPYTKASMKYKHYYTILFDNKSTCEKYLEWFNKCFKTIQEQEAEKEELSKKMNMYKKIFKAREDLKKINENKEKNNNSKKKNKKKK